MSVNRPDTGFKTPIDKDPIVFVAGGIVCSLPNLQWDLLAQRSSDALANAGDPSTQVLWMIGGAKEAERIVSSIALGAPVVTADSLHAERRVIVVSGPETRNAALGFASELDDPILISLGKEDVSAEEGTGSSIRIIGENSAHAATLAGIVAALLELSPGSSAQEVLMILVTFSNRA